MNLHKNNSICTFPQSVQFSRSVVSDSLQPHGLYPAGLPCPWDSPGKNSGVGCRFLLQVMSWKKQNCGDREEPRGHAGREPGGAGGRARGRGYVTTRVCQNSGWHAKGIPRMDVTPQFLRRLKTRSKSPTVLFKESHSPEGPKAEPQGRLVLRPPAIQSCLSDAPGPHPSKGQLGPHSGPCRKPGEARPPHGVCADHASDHGQRGRHLDT